MTGPLVEEHDVDRTPARGQIGALGRRYTRRGYTRYKTKNSRQARKNY
jgi:hypothetical protein